MRVLYLLLFLCGGFTLLAQPPEFSPQPCYAFVGTTPAPFQTLLSVVGDLGDGANAEAPTAQDWVGVFDKEGYLVGLTQLLEESGSILDCPDAPGSYFYFNVSIAPESPGSPQDLNDCPSSTDRFGGQYGLADGEEFDVVIWDASRDLFFSTGVSRTYASGTNDDDDVIGSCTVRDYSQPYIILPNFLPFQLTSFSATGAAKRVELVWTSAKEEAASHYGIERSGDGQNWTELGRVSAANAGEAVNRYTFTDAAPRAGTNFYRLRMVDLDGSATLSHVVQVQFSGAVGSLSTLPNPARVGEEIRLNLGSEWGEELTANVFDGSGRRVLSAERIPADRPALRLPAHLPGGVYVLWLTDGTTTVSERLIVRE